jgi:hypothetical protein
MYELKKNGKESKFVGTGPSSYKKNNLPGRGLTNVEKRWSTLSRSLLSTSQSRVELGYDVIEGTEWFVSLWTRVALGEVYGKSEGKIFQHKIQACRHITVAVRWKFFYHPTGRIPTSRFSPLDEMGKLGARSSTLGAREHLRCLAIWIYRDADKSLPRPASRCILFDG